MNTASTIQDIEISEDNFVVIQGGAGEYEVIVWPNELDSVDDDGSNAISRTTVSEITGELAYRADVINTL